MRPARRKALALSPTRKLNGVEIVTLAKHLAKSGFVFAVASQEKGKGPSDDLATIVFRGAAGRDVKPIFARLMGTAMGANKPAVVKKGGRNVVVVPMASGKDSWSWWAEQNDLVITLGKQTDEAVLEVIDGKRPNAVEHPLRADLARTEAGFNPVAVFFMDATAAPSGSEAAKGLAPLVAAGLTRVDYRWGFNDDALMSVTRLKAPKPRKGVLALFDQPTFDKGKLPPLPDGIDSFTVVSVDAVKALDTLLALAPTPDAKGKITEPIDTLKTKARIDLRKDLLSHLGPKVAVYIMPGTTPTRSAGEGEGRDAAAGAPAAGGGPFAGVLGGPAAMLGLGGSQPIPRLTLVAEIDKPVLVARTLDNLMVFVNRQLKEQAAEAAAEARAGEGDEPAAKTKGARRPSAASVQAPEFKLMPGAKETERIYVLNLPPGQSRRLPVGFRPTVRLGATQLVVSVTPDAARLALDAKPGAWTPSAELAPAFDQLPNPLMVLNVSDPRSTMPELLASLPATLQRGVNTAVALGQARATEGANGARRGGPRGPGNVAAGMPGPGGGYPGAAGGSSNTPGAIPGGSSSPYPGAGSSSSSSSSGGYPGAQPGPGGMPGAAGGDAASGATTLQFDIDPAKLPKADDLRAKLFPGSFAISADDQEVRIVSRQAFPNLVSPGSAIGIALALPAIQAAAHRRDQGRGGPGSRARRSSRARRCGHRPGSDDAPRGRARRPRHAGRQALSLTDPGRGSTRPGRALLRRLVGARGYPG